MGTAVNVRGFNDLVGLVYEGVEESRPWTTLMRRLSQATDAHDASMVISSSVAPGVYYLVTDNEDPVATGPERIDGVMSVNVLLDLAQPRATLIEELMPVETFLSTALYQRFLKPLNIRHLLGQDVLRDDVLKVKISLERTADQPPFTKREKQLIEMVTPHLQRAIRMRERQSDSSHMRSLFEEAIGRVGIGCLMLNAHGRIVSMNARAREFVDTGDVILVRNGRLRVAEGVDSRSLAKAIDLALAAHRNACRIQRGVGLRLESAPGIALLDLVVKPLFAEKQVAPLMAEDAPAVVVYINDCRVPGVELAPEVLAQMYSLTPCEAQLAALLARGTSIDEASELLRVSVNTIKTHLRGIYEKMGTNKQAQVVARLNHSSARLL